MSLLTPLVPAFPNTLTNGTPADASQVMADFNTLRNAINTVLNATGATGGDQYVGLTTDARFNGTSVHDALTQLVDRQSLYTDTGATNAMVITPNPAMATLAAGQVFWLKPANTTTVNTATIAIGSNTAVTFANQDGTTLPAGALIAGSYYQCVTAGPGNPVRVMNPSRISGSATLTGTGFSGTPPTCTMTYRVSADAMLAYLIFGSGIAGTSNATSFTLTGMPPILTPAQTQSYGTSAEDSTSATAANMTFTAFSTVITLGKSTALGSGASNWTASGTKAFSNGATSGFNVAQSIVLN